MKIKIKVTKEILKKSMMCGVRMEPGGITQNCAVALAVREIFPNADVTSFNIWLNDELFTNIRLPENVKRFVSLFDYYRTNPSARLDMESIDFEIEVPQAVIDRIGIGEVYKILSESKTLELVQI